MKDSRIEKLAYNVVNYAIELKADEKVLIDCSCDEMPLTKEIIKQIYKAGGVPFLNIHDDEILKEILNGLTIEQAKAMASYEINRMKDVDAHISVKATKNSKELSSVPAEKMKIFLEYYKKPLRNIMLKNRAKWSNLDYPSYTLAQMSGMSSDDFEDFYFQVCNMDYKKMSDAMDNLVKYMEKVDKVRIIGKNTDLEFLIKGIPVVKSDGKRNIPDGEVYTAPVKNSVNGRITYNVPSTYNGIKYENVSLEFKNGKIVNATANYTDKINKIFDTDEGARYIGEFAIGVNPYISEPMNNILFDEKIHGSIHFTPGNYLDTIDNGNRSAIHWDLVLIQRVEYGGGEIWFDDVLIRKDGIFVLDELQCLNPQNLK